MVSFFSLFFSFLHTLVDLDQQKTQKKKTDSGHPASGQAPRARRNQGPAHRARGAALGQGREARVRLARPGPVPPGGAWGAGEFEKGKRVFLELFSERERERRVPKAHLAFASQQKRGCPLALWRAERGEQREMKTTFFIFLNNNKK